MRHNTLLLIWCVEEHAIAMLGAPQFRLEYSMQGPETLYQGSYNFGENFSNRVNIRASTQFKRESQSQHLER